MTNLAFTYRSQTKNALQSVYLASTCKAIVKVGDQRLEVPPLGKPFPDIPTAQHPPLGCTSGPSVITVGDLNIRLLHNLILGPMALYGVGILAIRYRWSTGPDQGGRRRCSIPYQQD
jgi:hypothetical protein